MIYFVKILLLNLHNKSLRVLSTNENFCGQNECTLHVGLHSYIYAFQLYLNTCICAGLNSTHNFGYQNAIRTRKRTYFVVYIQPIMNKNSLIVNQKSLSLEQKNGFNKCFICILENLFHIFPQVIFVVQK